MINPALTRVSEATLVNAEGKGQILPKIENIKGIYKLIAAVPSAAAKKLMKGGYFMANLKHQFIRSITENERYGESKYLFKREVGLGGTEFFSYNDTKNIKDTAVDFSRYIKENFSEIKLAKDINVKHIESFLEYKQSNGCKNATIKQYNHRLYKLSLCLNKTYSLNLNWRIDIKDVDELKTRKLRMTDDDFNKMLSTAKRECESLKAVKLARHTGLRADALSRLKAGYFNEKKGTLLVYKDKGGRTYTKILRPEAIRLLSEYTKDKGKDEYIFSNGKGGHIKASSISQYLQDHLKKAGISKYSDAKTSIHAIRKLYAKEEYDKLINQGMDKSKALNRVSNELGHGNDRIDVLNTYIL